MKNNTLVGIAFLVVLALAAGWFNRIADSPEHNSKEVTPSAGSYVLAVSWQPAFCEQRPNKPECRTQRGNRFDASHFSLHGLWPQPIGNSYCGVSEDVIRLDKSGKWRSLPKLELSEGLRSELAIKMPGYRSFLHRHEWFKHGTCLTNSTPEEYFSVSLAMLDQLNASAVRNLFARETGKKLDFAEIEAAMKRAFGNAAGDRFILDCYRDNGRRIAQEIKLSLRGNISESTDLKALLSQGATMPRSCPSGIVDPVGIQ